MTNYSQPRDRVNNLLIQAIHPSHNCAGPTWALLGGADIGHIVNLVASGPGVGTTDSYFIEGLQYSIRPADPDWGMVDLTLNMSPLAFWETDPF